jgi:3-phosphoshikimate 1-carboxyvinyltransferase
MKFVKPSRVDGSVAAPPSKSMTQRAFALAALTRGESEIRHFSVADDALSALDIATEFAAGVRLDPVSRSIFLAGGGAPETETLDCGESGLAMRMFAAVAALQKRPLTLTATGSLARRPVGFIEDTLRALGAEAQTAGGLPPLRVCGPLRGGRATVDGAVSSQFLSGLLIALPRCRRHSRLTVANLKSKPYVRLTLAMVRQAGGIIRCDDDLAEFEIPGRQKYQPQTYIVERDWSGAAFLLAAGAIAGRVTVRGLDPQSEQADRAVLDALRLAGARVEIGGDGVTVVRDERRAFAFDATDCPDLFPPLAALAACCAGTSALTGVGRLRHKESDRAAALIAEFGKIGAALRVDGDVLLVAGAPLTGGEVDSHGDHRIAMALAVAALASRDGVNIRGEGCVAKSYPDFFEDLLSIAEPKS